MTVVALCLEKSELSENLCSHQSDTPTHTAKGQLHTLQTHSVSLSRYGNVVLCDEMFVFVWSRAGDKSQAAGELHTKTKILLKCVYLSVCIKNYVGVCVMFYIPTP